MTRGRKAERRELTPEERIESNRQAHEAEVAWTQRLDVREVSNEETARIRAIKKGLRSDIADAKGQQRVELWLEASLEIEAVRNQYVDGANREEYPEFDPVYEDGEVAAVLRELWFPGYRWDPAGNGVSAEVQRDIGYEVPYAQDDAA